MGVPVVLVGTYKALAVLSGKFSQLRRGTGQGDMIWDRMVKGEQWELFVKALFSAQYTRKRFSPTDRENPKEAKSATLSDVLYQESQGITDLAVKLYMFAQERAIDIKKEIVTANIIRSVARDKFVMLRDVLTALRSKEKFALAKWDDIYPHALKEYLDSFSQTGSQNITIEGTVANDPEIQNTIPSIGEPPAPPLSPPTKPDSRSSGNNKSQPSRKPSKLARQSKPVLPDIVKSGLQTKISAYDALKQHGYIKPASEFLS